MLPRNLILLLLLPVAAACAKEDDFMRNRWVVILTVSGSFAEQRASAEKVAKQSGMPFSMEGRVFDKKRGLIYPDNFGDEAFAGGYVARSEHQAEVRGRITDYISVERSDGYDGFKRGYYIVVAGVHASAAAAEAQAARLKAWVPSAYAKKTRIYMGCLH